MFAHKVMIFYSFVFYFAYNPPHATDVVLSPKMESREASPPISKWRGLSLDFAKKTTTPYIFLGTEIEIDRDGDRNR